jgi:AcrR family transcriptional regulator
MQEQDEVQRPGRRELNRQAKLRSIETAGRDLFNAKGFEETTTREIARSAGVGTGTLFLYFPEKRDLLLHLFKHDIAEVNARAFASVPRLAPLQEQLIDVFRRCYDFYGRDLRLSRSFLRELCFAEPETRRRSSDEDGFAKMLEELTRKAQERHELRNDMDPRRAAGLFMNIYLVGLMSWLVGSLPSREALGEIVGGNLELCIEGLGASRA